MKPTTSQFDRVFLRPQYAVHYRRARRTQWTSEARADYTTLFLLQGKLTCRIAESATEIKENAVLLLDPGTTAMAGGYETEYLTISLSPSLILDSAVRTRLIGAGANVTFAVKVVESNQRLARLARDLADELTAAEAGQEIVVAALVEQIVVQLLRHHANMRRSPELELSRVGLVDRRIRRAVELMHAHLAEDLPLEEIAAAANLSPFHFARLFKLLTGATPHAYLATLRTARAQALLAETDLSITEISTRIGYNSSSHFAKAFRQTTGLTPRAFRAAIGRG